jgi:hypothetical protein
MLLLVLGCLKGTPGLSGDPSLTSFSVDSTPVKLSVIADFKFIVNILAAGALEGVLTVVFL